MTAALLAPQQAPSLFDQGMYQITLKGLQRPPGCLPPHPAPPNPPSPPPPPQGPSSPLVLICYCILFKVLTRVTMSCYAIAATHHALTCLLHQPVEPGNPAFTCISTTSTPPTPNPFLPPSFPTPLLLHSCAFWFWMVGMHFSAHMAV